MVKKKPLDELQNVPRGTVVTFAELSNLCGGGLTMGDNVSVSRAVNLVDPSDRSVPWWRVVSTGSRPIRDLLHKDEGRKKVQEQLLLEEGVELDRPIVAESGRRQADRSC